MNFQEYEAAVDRELSRQNTSRKTVFVYDLPTRSVMDAYYQKISPAEFAASALQSNFSASGSNSRSSSEKEEPSLF